MIRMIFVELILKGVTEKIEGEIHETLRQLQQLDSRTGVDQGWSKRREANIIQISSPGGSNHTAIVMAVGKIALEHRAIEVTIDESPSILEQLIRV